VIISQEGSIKGHMPRFYSTWLGKERASIFLRNGGLWVCQSYYFHTMKLSQVASISKYV
jgi:hypothetical protein